MHDTHLLKNILKYFQEQEDSTSRKLKKAHLSISEFGSLNKEHFLEHYQQIVCGTRFEEVEIAVDMVSFGPELEITGLDFESKNGGLEKSEICKLKENKS
jgi:Zn finger protein HypA/HybF involved in hydrogenase expression